MPELKVLVEDGELLSYAEDNNIVDWNTACDIIRDLYPTDGDGISFVCVQDMIQYPDQYNKLLYDIVVGFATEHDAEFKTLQGFSFYSS